jgi:mannose-6-phosphate isomerase-like protein (cupin superfamily)
MAVNLALVSYAACMSRTLALFAAVCLLSLAASRSQTQSTRPLAFKLDCSVRDCPLLKGVPQTAGMRSGFVRLRPGESVGWHSTNGNEESLVILTGGGQALIEGQSAREFSARELVYIPPSARHNITNTGADVLEYVYVVAPVASR